MYIKVGLFDREDYKGLNLKGMEIHGTSEGERRQNNREGDIRGSLYCFVIMGCADYYL